MSHRPYFRTGIEELELLFKAAQDAKSLSQIRHELQFRNTQRALSLLRKVEDAIGTKSKTSVDVRTSEALTGSALVHLPAKHSSVLPDGSNERKSAHSDAVPTEHHTEVNFEASHRSPRASVPIKDAQLESDAERRKGAPERAAPSENHARLLDLLEYLEHLAKIGEKPVFSLKEYQQLVFSEHELKGKIGISHDVSSDEGQVWLRIERLQRTEPPSPTQDVRDWIVLSRDPNQLPKVQDLLTRSVTGTEADELVRVGSVKPDDRSQSPKMRDGKPMVDVILRLDALPSIKAAVLAYISTKWTPWAEAEKPRRATIAIYDRFFSLYQSLQAEGVERPLEVVWGIGVARWRIRSHEIDHPLIEQLAELEVDTESGVITIGPRSSQPQLALKPYFSLEVDGADATLSFAKHFLEAMPPDLEFSPFQPNTFEPVLRFASTHLDSSGRYHPDDLKDVNDRTVPALTGSLLVTDTWAIYARPRSANFFIEDLDRLQQTVAASPELPGPSKKLVETPSSETTYSPTFIDITKATLGGPQSGLVSDNAVKELPESEMEFFFPKPFNADQVAIVQRLEEADGVVVQGPPGTGKTHTIANIICHCLATGRKVLVTSKGEAALAVLRDHIPEGIRDLTISLLTNEREGLKQLERAVSLLASTATQMNPAALEKQILAGQQQILELKKRLASIDIELADFAKKHLGKIPHKASADGLLPIELAQLLSADADRHSWLPDTMTLDSRYDPQFNDEDIVTLRRARRLLGKDICYVTASVPALADLPDGAHIVTIHEDLVNCALLESSIQKAYFPRLRLSSVDSVERCKGLSDSVKQMLSLWDIVGDMAWLKPFVERWLKSEPDTEKEKLFESLLIAIGDVSKKRTEMLAYAIFCPEATIGNAELLAAIHRAATGERPFGLMPFGKSQARHHFSLIRIEGRTPHSMEDWYKVERYLTWRSKVSSTIARWNAITGEYGLPPLKDQGDVTARWLSDTLDKVEKVKWAAQRAAPLIRRELPDLFPHGVAAESVINSRDHAARAVESIEPIFLRCVTEHLAAF